MFLSEPWMSLHNFPVNWFTRLNYNVFDFNDRGNLSPNLWCICKIDIDPHVISIYDQQLTFTIKEDSHTFAISAVYASTDYIKRRLLWQALDDMKLNLNLTWVS